MVQYMRDYYAVLGLSPRADARMIRAAYRTLARANHPDLIGPPGLRRMVLLNEAYGVLGNPTRRRAYDAERLGRILPSPSWSAAGSEQEGRGPRERLGIMAYVSVLAVSALAGVCLWVVMDPRGQAPAWQRYVSDPGTPVAASAGGRAPTAHRRTDARTARTDAANESLSAAAAYATDDPPAGAPGVGAREATSSGGEPAPHEMTARAPAAVRDPSPAVAPAPEPADGWIVAASASTHTPESAHAATLAETAPAPILAAQPTAPAAVTAEPRYGYHQVEPGESLSYIAQSYGVAQAVIMQLNGLTDPNRVQAGSRLLVPLFPVAAAVNQAVVSTSYEYTLHVVQPGENLLRIAERYGVSQVAIMDLNGLSDPNRIGAGAVLRVPPR